MNKTKPNPAGLSTLVMQVRVPDSEAKQTEESEFCSREKFIARSFKETGSLCLKSPELCKALLQTRWEGAVCDQLVTIL